MRKLTGHVLASLGQLRAPSLIGGSQASSLPTRFDAVDTAIKKSRVEAHRVGDGHFNELFGVLLRHNQRIRHSSSVNYYIDVVI